MGPAMVLQAVQAFRAMQQCASALRQPWHSHAMYDRCHMGQPPSGHISLKSDAGLLYTHRAEEELTRACKDTCKVAGVQ